MLRPAFAAVTDLALDQHGYFTVAQARAAGVAPTTVVMMARRGTIERVATGLYRLPTVPGSALAGYMAAALWPRGVHGTLSHETALELLQLSDVNPADIHLTVPSGYRIRRSPPRAYVVHQADLTRAETTLVEGIPVTTAERTIRDCHAMHLDPALLRQAIAQARETGRLTSQAAERLSYEIFGARPSRRRPRHRPPPRSRHRR